MSGNKMALIVKPEVLDKIDLIISFLVKEGYKIDKYMVVNHFIKYLRCMYENELDDKKISYLEKAYGKTAYKLQDRFYILLISHKNNNTVKRIKEDIGHHSSYHLDGKHTLRGLFGLSKEYNVCFGDFIVHFNGFHVIDINKAVDFLSKIENEDILSIDYFLEEEYPKRVSWIITSRCNLQCKHCYVASLPRLNDHIELEKAYEIIEILNNLNVESVFLSGGEPLLYEYLDDILHALKDYNFSVGLCTNGILLPKWVKKLRYYVDYVSIGLESIDPKKYAYIRGTDIYKVIDGIKLVRKYGLNTSIDVTLVKQNIDEIDEIFEFARKLDINSIFLRRFIPLGRGAENREIFEISGEQFKKCIEHAIELSKEYDIEVYSEDPIFSLCLNFHDKNFQNYDERFLHGCRACGISFGIYIENFYFCPVISKYRNMGKISDYSMDDLKKILSNNVLKKQNNYQGKCNKCDFFTFCKGCRAHSFAISGNILGDDPLCPIKI